ncbi:hypothetical protein VaNZ11_001494 [Volvox africanus]|uniref:Uncharacterized protein n=1 Tax=Volvox africanus TaxID=51714 RepID=A0ABQ5RQI5_9CHLO|nr:hypothetical protein VaNZ11_001494 [Volvox africanus]
MHCDEPLLNMCVMMHSVSLRSACTLKSFGSFEDFPSASPPPPPPPRYGLSDVTCRIVPQADEVYLQQMLEESIPIGDPLGPQSRRYLETLLRNPSWSFAQRRQAVQRLIQLNTHFASQVPAQEGGSPFAPLFAVGGGAVVPRLGPLREGEQKSAIVRPRGLGSRGGPAAKPLQLPKGF